MNSNFRKTVVGALVAAMTLGSAGGAFAQRHDRDRHDNDHDRWGNHVDVSRGYGPDHNWRMGQRMPREYHSRQYVVDDWRGHHLRPPPRGYHWVQSGGDYLLVAVATGLIASAIINSGR
ncbi:RcnB family protein [Pelomonas sp. KK5]|uniref:RcnB family protein n=1 Tax=Pelomonas sp. KK5 TaxID=1855730 RepID=UPI00097BE279|nr:RcnB family protein [Pelomonas sp. KK5]